MNLMVTRNGFLGDWVFNCIILHRDLRISFLISFFLKSIYFHFVWNAERLSTHWFFLQIPTMLVRVITGIQSASPSWMEGIQYLRHYWMLPRKWINRRLESEIKPGFRHLNMGRRNPSWQINLPSLKRNGLLCSSDTIGSFCSLCYVYCVYVKI